MQPLWESLEQYKRDPTFPQFPPEIKLGEVSGVATDVKGNLWITDNASHTVMKCSPEGKVLLTLGDRGSYRIQVFDAPVWLKSDRAQCRNEAPYGSSTRRVVPRRN